MLRLGFAEVDITPDRPVELVGFHRKDNRSKGVLKPLLAQTAVFEADERCCLVTVDSIGFTKELTDGLRERVCRILDVAPEKVMVCFSHTHAAPEADFEREYYEETCRRIEGAVSRAKGNMEPAAAGWGNAHASIGVNRRKVSDATDNRIGILKVCRAADGTPKLLVLRVTAHANVLKRDNCRISPDYFGSLRETAGKKFGCPVMVVQGAAGNTAPKYFCSDETPVDATGSQYIRSDTALEDMADVITGSVEEVYGKIRLREDCGVRVYSRWIRLESDVPGREEALRVAGEARTLCGITDSGWADKVARLNAAGVHVQEEDVEVQYLAVGDGCLCGAPYELMVGFALETEKLLENEFFYANGYTNGNLLYFPTEEEFDAGGYEVFWSMLIYWPYVDRVYPFRRESASKLIRFMAENAPAGFDHSGRNVPD